jgi:hypothetical protein
MDKIPYDQLIDMVAVATGKVAPGSKWQHFKGGECIVKGIVLIEETNEPSVLYSSVSHPEVSFVRPLSTWLESIERNGQSQPRFVRL